MYLFLFFRCTANQTTPIHHIYCMNSLWSSDAIWQHWLKYRLVVKWRQPFSWTSFDFSSKVFCGIHLREISHQVLMSFTCIQIIHFWKLLSYLPGVNELNGGKWQWKDYLQTGRWQASHNTFPLKMVYCHNKTIPRVAIDRYFITLWVSVSSTSSYMINIKVSVPFLLRYTCITLLTRY